MGSQPWNSHWFNEIAIVQCGNLLTSAGWWSEVSIFFWVWLLVVWSWGRHDTGRTQHRAHETPGCWVLVNTTILRTRRFPGVYPQIIHFNRIFHYKPSITWGALIYGNPHMMKWFTASLIGNGHDTVHIYRYIYYHIFFGHWILMRWQNLTMISNDVRCDDHGDLCFEFDVIWCDAKGTMTMGGYSGYSMIFKYV